MKTQDNETNRNILEGIRSKIKLLKILLILVPVFTLLIKRRKIKMIELCKNKPCYMSQCNHCRVSVGDWATCSKTKDEQRKINLFIKHTDLVDEIDREIMKDKPDKIKIQILSKELYDLIQ